jgi:Fic family protein
MKFNPEEPFPLPNLPPEADLSNRTFADDLLAARVELAELKGYTELLPNPLLLISPAVLRESIASSEIENIHTTILDALQMQLFPEAERRENDKEVLRYRDALMEGFGLLGELPVCTRMIHRIHRGLIPSGEEDYRRLQNRIVDGAGRAVYTPPEAQKLPRLMQNWEEFLNRQNDKTDPLIKSAMAHYQFEAIHPFSDGNGRCGRILIVLYLVQAGLLRWPILFISGYLIRQRADYYRLLRVVTREGDWEGFIRFMLAGFHQQAVETRALLLETMKLLSEWKNRVRQSLPKIYSRELIEALFSTPITTPLHLARALGVHYTTSTRYLRQLQESGFLKSRTQGKYHLFMNYELLDLLQHQKPARQPRSPELETVPVET